MVKYGPVGRSVDISWDVGRGGGRGMQIRQHITSCCPPSPFPPTESLKVLYQLSKPKTQTRKNILLWQRNQRGKNKHQTFSMPENIQPKNFDAGNCPQSTRVEPRFWQQAGQLSTPAYGTQLFQPREPERNKHKSSGVSPCILARAFYL